MRPINSLVVHCSATPEGVPFHAADIDRWHKARGWTGIGYHFVICIDGSVEPGRPVEAIGAHVEGHNADSIGICYIGGMDPDNVHPEDTLTDKQADALELLLHGMRGKWPNARILGHRDFPNVHKACPSFDVASWCTRRGFGGNVGAAP